MRAGPTPGSSSSTERVIALSRRPRWNSIAKRCASSRTRWSSWSSGVSWASRSGSRRPGHEHLLDPLREADHGHAEVAELAERARARPRAGRGRRRSRSAQAATRSCRRTPCRAGCARAASRTGPSAVRAPRPWLRSHPERSPGWRSAGSPTSWARRPRTPPSRRPVWWPIRFEMSKHSIRIGICSIPSARWSPSSASIRCERRRSERSRSWSSASRALRSASSRMRRLSPRSAWRTSTGAPRRSVSASDSASRFLHRALHDDLRRHRDRARVVLEHELLGHLALLALAGVLEVEALAVGEHAVADLEHLRVGVRALGGHGDRVERAHRRVRDPLALEQRAHGLQLVAVLGGLLELLLLGRPSSSPGRAPSRCGGSGRRGSR